MEPETDPAGGASDKRSAETTQYAAGDLKISVGDYMPTLKGFSLEIAAPQGWDWKRPGGQYIVGFIPKGSDLDNLPRILVSAEGNPFPGLSRVTEDNVQEFADLVSQRHAGEKLSESVQPIILGSNILVRHTSLAKRKNLS